MSIFLFLYINFIIPGNVRRIARKLKKNGYSAYLVGGSIRDILLYRSAFDYDLATDALPHEVKTIFKKVIPTGIKHGTVTVLIKKNTYEITTLRNDGKYSDGRRPDKVQFTTDITEDLSRRDFTMNGIALDLIKGRIYDPFQGKKDIKNHIIRAIGNPKDRYREDALRMFRACRFASQLSFRIEANTFADISVNREQAKCLSAERIRDEFVKIIKSPKPSVGLELLRKSGLLKIFLPELLEGYEIIQNEYHKYDVYYHNLYSCDAASKDNYIIRLAALFHDLGKSRTKRSKESAITEDSNSFYNHEIVSAKMAYRILKRMKFSNDEINRITHLIRYHMFYYTHDWTAGAVRRFIRNVGSQNLGDLFALRLADRVGNGKKSGQPVILFKFIDRIDKIMAEDAAFKIKDLDIDGNMIMNELNLKPGPLIGEILEHLLEICLDDPENNRQVELIKLAKQYYEKKSQYTVENYGKKPEELNQYTINSQKKV